MKTLEFRVEFVVPAFLGDATQSGRWRTPPFKAQLRQWWRVVYAADKGFSPNLAEMREVEGRLFGNAWLENHFCKSVVRLRLDRWDEGGLKKAQWPPDSKVEHPEVKKSHGLAVPIGSALYLGYGPLEFRSGTALKHNAAIQAGEFAKLSLAVPDVHAAPIERALALMHRYGTVGGRSRNGWGSYLLKPQEGTAAPSAGALPVRDWKDCLGLDWPHALGRDDGGPLIWRTAPHADWKALMRTLAVIKIGLRTQFHLTTGNRASQTEDRHWLSYPVTNHSVSAWGNNARLPNTLRFKVRQAPDAQLVGVIFHVPHLPPAAFHPDRAAIERVWRQVHVFLDAPEQKLTRSKE